MVLALVMAGSLWAIGRRSQATSKLKSLALVAIGSQIGAAVVFAQLPPLPGTHPFWTETSSAGAFGESVSRSNPGSFTMGADVMVHAVDGSINVRLSPLSLTVSPLLSFLSQSPDGCWTVLSRALQRAGPEPRLAGISSGEEDGSRLLFYTFPGQGPARMKVARNPDGRSTVVEVMTRLDRPVYSHLNTYCDLEVRGHRRLALAFSPCPDAQVEVRHFDYPRGRPARFAYVDQARRFRVVEASSGEKGPFQVLAEGRLEPSDPLTITLCDEGRPVGRITLADWSAQVATQLSPTAGWGVPVNAIEFSLSPYDHSPSGPASIFITLAATSVGRGWDCVGHAAGTYRNRITIAP